ncbi:MAG: UDP-N-acetylglucosamine 2-epimerase (non-hydrolyzing) [Rhodospirillaceae bacterium]
MDIHLIAAARPNFMKVAPLWHALKRRDAGLRPVLVHTGQHYDPEMSGDFLRDLSLPSPDVQLGVGSGSHARQTAAILTAYEDVCLQQPPALTIVVGDVNSTLACALAAKKLTLPVAHLEAGLRSGDRSMPEEINRLVTDSISDWLWTPSPDADENLRREGASDERIVRVGNIMIDSFAMMRERIAAQPLPEGMSLKPGGYAVATFHRPANVDSLEVLSRLLATLVQLSEELPIVFPVHPRTRARIDAAGLLGWLQNALNLYLLPPQGYVEFMALVTRAALAITDSGGVQEETTYLRIPCLTLRPNTERPITISQGSNRLTTVDRLLDDAREACCLSQEATSSVPELWDGLTADRVVDQILRLADQGSIE